VLPGLHRVRGGPMTAILAAAVGVTLGLGIWFRSMREGRGE
jgi:hypothetical protein